MKIVQLQTTNVKRIRAVAITPGNDALVVVGGKNAAGKSSVLDSIAMALGGADLVPERPLRDGAERGEVSVELDGGIIVKRTFTKGGGGGLTVTASDGTKYKSPQTMLDQLVSRLSFDPLAFKTMDGRGQGEQLQQIVGLDTSAVDNEKGQVFAARADANREVKRIEVLIASTKGFDDAPAEEVSIADLIAKLSAADAVHAEQAATRKELDDARAGFRKAEAWLLERQKAVADLKHALAASESALAAAEEARSKAATHGRAAKLVVDALPALPDRDAIRTRLADADATNAKARANAQLRKLSGELGGAREKAAVLTDQLTALEQQRTELVAGAKYPVPGLGFDANGNVTFKGVPFAQASTAEQLRVSVAVGLSLNPELKVLLVRNGNDLDAANLKLLGQIAQVAGAQVWVERVAETAEGVTVFIEDGAVKA